MRVKRRGRLVHDDEAAVERERLGDLHELALRQREAHHRRVGGEIDAEAGEDRPDRLAELRAVDEAERAAAPRLAADEDVGGGVEVVEEVELLVDESDAGGDGARDGHRGARGAVDADRARARRDDAAEDLHQGRLARAVLADEADDLAGGDGEADIVESDDAGIGLGDPEKFEKRFGHALTRTAPHGWRGRVWAGGRDQLALAILALRSDSNSSTLALFTTLVGMMISLSAGICDLSPPR